MFINLYNFFKSRPKALWLTFALSILLAGILACKVKFVEDVSSLLPDSKALKTLNEIASHTQAGEQLIFLSSLKDTAVNDQDSLIAATSAFTEGLQKELGYGIDTINAQPAGSSTEAALAEIFNNHLPLFLTEKDYVLIDSLTQPARIRQTLHSSRSILLSPASVVYKNIVSQDPLGISRLAYSKLSRLQWDTTYSIYDGYLFAKEGRKLTFFVKPKRGNPSSFYQKLEAYTNNWQRQHPAIHLAFFGGPAVAAGNATQLREDTIVTLSATILLLIILTFYYFRKKRTPFLLLIPVIYGGLTGLAVMYLVQGSVSLIALGAGAIVLGIAIDYSVHFLSHLRHASVPDTIRDLQQPLTIGSFTTIAAFLSLRLVHTPILRDLGLFAAASLVGAALCTLIFLPHFPLGKADEHPRKTIFDKLGHWQPEKNKWLLWGIVLLTPVMIWFSFGVQFDDDLMHLNYRSASLIRSQDEVSEVSSAALSAVFVIGKGKDEGDAMQKLASVTPLIDSLIAKGLVRTASNPATLISSPIEVAARMQRWRAFWTKNRLEAIVPAIHQAAIAEGYSADAFDDYAARVTGFSPEFSADEMHVLHSLFPGGFDDSAKMAIASLRVAPEHRKEVLKALGARPLISVADRQQGAAQMVQVLAQDFNSIALYSSLIVFFTLLISYGRIELAIISFLPMAISWVWILGLMSIFGLKFNIVNIIISTLIFGLGDDYSIFTMDGLIERYKYGGSKLASVRTAVYVSVATVLMGLGVLLLAKHPALRSIAAISVTGMICVLFISQTLQPALYNSLIQKRADKGLQPFTMWSLMKSTFAFLYFLAAAVILTILGIVFTKLWPFGKERGRYLLHCCIRASTGSLLGIMANVKKRKVHRELADFSKPAIFIANHSSFLDILITTAMHPKLVLLTNRWVYRSPVFGAVVRMGEYYPVADGAEESLEPLRELVSRGYSIVIFPEGTRSYSDDVGRFHKGAFYLSQNLGLDIAPLVIHGAHYTMQKGDWLLKNGVMTTYYHPRIKADDKRHGQAFVAMAKSWRQWYRLQLESVKERDETPRYFKEQLIRTYTFKGPVLEWYCRIKSRMEKYWETAHTLLPREGLIYDLGCGYGFATYLLHWSASGRTFISIDYDEEKIAVASQNFLKNDAVHFSAGDITEHGLQPCNGILLHDVLHYLTPEKQNALLQKCATALRPGGVMLVRDGVTELAKRQRSTALTELFSTKLLGFNKTVNELHFLSVKKMEDFAAMYGLELEVRDETKSTSNLLFVLRKPATIA